MTESIESKIMFDTTIPFSGTLIEKRGPTLFMITAFSLHSISVQPLGRIVKENYG